MAQGKEPKWQKEIERILRGKLQGKEFQDKRKELNALLILARDVEVPRGDTGELVAMILNSVSRELRPLASVYAGFQLGVAYERYLNANRT